MKGKQLKVEQMAKTLFERGRAIYLEAGGKAILGTQTFEMNSEPVNEVWRDLARQLMEASKGNKAPRQS